MAETIDVDELIAILRPKVDTAAKAYPEADAINIWRSVSTTHRKESIPPRGQALRRRRILFLESTKRSNRLSK